MPLDLWPWAHLYPRKARIVQKLIIVFIENWKEIGPWSWLIWITWWLLFISIILRGWTGVKVWPNTQTLGKSCHCKNLSSSKRFEWHFYYLWGLPVTKISAQSDVIDWSYCSKNPKNGSWRKRRSGLFLLKSEMANTQKLKLDIQTV